MTDHVRTLSRATIASCVATATEIGLLWLLVHPLHVPRWVAFEKLKRLAAGVALARKQV